MNKVVLIGRLTKDPVIGTNGETKHARYTLAVDRGYKKDNQQQADFISCVAFKGSADFAEKYLHKGMKIAVTGRIQTGSYTNRNGDKVYTTDVMVDQHEFVESKSESSQAATSAPQAPASAQAPQTATEDFMSVPEGVDEDLPFS